MKNTELFYPKNCQRSLAYDRISEEWEKFISLYDTNRRIEVLIDDYLGEKAIAGKKCLDAGCGLGYFTHAILKYKPGSLSACDISPRLVAKLTEKLISVRCFTADILQLPEILRGETFNVVLCSDVIEHTENPRLAVKKLTQAVTPGGLLAISVPNKRWRWLLSLATISGLRKNYQSYENYVSPADLKTWIKEDGFRIVRYEGIHTIPFKIFPKKILRALDQILRYCNYPYALNLAVLAQKDVM